MIIINSRSYSSVISHLDISLGGAARDFEFAIWGVSPHNRALISFCCNEPSMAGHSRTVVPTLEPVSKQPLGRRRELETFAQELDPSAVQGNILLAVIYKLYYPTIRIAIIYSIVRLWRSIVLSITEIV